MDKVSDILSKIMELKEVCVFLKEAHQAVEAREAETDAEASGKARVLQFIGDEHSRIVAEMEALGDVPVKKTARKKRKAPAKKVK